MTKYKINCEEDERATIANIVLCYFGEFSRQINCVCVSLDQVRQSKALLS